MTEKNMEKLADVIVKRFFERIEADTKAMNAEFVDELIDNESQLKELHLLLRHYEKNEDYIKAANVFATIKKLEELDKQ
jgi:protein-arginine kinase activator protein McsA